MATARSIFEALLIETGKVGAPSLLLSDYNYYINRAIYQFINKRYNIYDINQQTTDDLRVLKSTAVLNPKKAEVYSDINLNIGSAKLFDGYFEVDLPDDYLHILNCVCIYKLKKRHKCYDKDNYVQFAAKRLTADSWSEIINNYYNRPTPERPYYYINNVNTNTDIPTNPVVVDSTGNIISGTDDADGIYDYSLTGGTSNFPRKVKIGSNSNPDNFIEREGAQRYGNASKVRCEIRYGRDTSVFDLVKVVVDYIKVPQVIRLTQEQVDLTEDTSQILEYPDYVIQEIINELVAIIEQTTGDPRLQTHIPISQSIANPQQTVQPQPKG